MRYTGKRADLVGASFFDPGAVEARGRGFAYRDRLKRIVDFVLALAILPVIAPTILALMALARLDGGPALYGGRRVGLSGRVFRCWKIRTMAPRAEERLQTYLDQNPDAAREWAVKQKLRRDPRITAIGKFMRRTSLDELPQIWNVLVGDMSLVGPRPFTPEQAVYYGGRASLYYQVRPGVTGLWQVGARNDSSFAARAAYDAEYVRNLSFPGDLAILAKTAGAVLRCNGC